ncbi:MAG: STAS domain-containing protein [Phycisphaerae bacterium]|jgi:anti-anti-sigma factor
MKVEQQRVGTVDVLSVSGALVDQDAEVFTKQLMSKIGAETKNPRIIVWLHEVPYMDSAAVEGLLTAADALEQRAVNLKLAGVPGTCREILELTGVSGRFSYFKDVQDAVKSFL